VLYREEGVKAILSWVTGLIQRLRIEADPTESFIQLQHLQATLHRAAATETPLLRLYEYAAEAPEEIVTVVSARKVFVFWDTEMVDDSREALPDISALWTFGEVLDSRADVPPPGRTNATLDSTVAQRARAYERRVHEFDARYECRRRQIDRLERLLALDARLAPSPAAVVVLPSRAAILWRPRFLDLVDVERLRRWLQHGLTHLHSHSALAAVSSFIESARHEYADLFLDAFCTDSPEAI
jgi:hypothetical protein